MLPSTGYFKGINCPFFDSGLCERPYCHFRHVKKDSAASGTNDGTESGAILQQLVTAAVQRVLQQSETSTTPTTHLTTVESGAPTCQITSTTKATYNPTPIAELNKMVTADPEEPEDIDDLIEQRKRHIPVPYTPRKPTTIPVKRPNEINGSSKPFIYNPPSAKYTPGCPENTEVDLYTPKGGVESNEKYLPGTDAPLQEYTPKTETQVANKHNYVPSDKKVNKKKVLEYKPVKISTKLVTTTYQPTPKALVPCFSSDEDEPVAKKPKIANDLNGLDDLGPEFDILDQILDEETQEEDNVDETDEKTERKKDKLSNSSKDSSKNKDISVDTSSTATKDTRSKESSTKNKHSNSNKESKLPSKETNEKDVRSHKSSSKKHKSSSGKDKQDSKRSHNKTKSKKSDKKDKSSTDSKCESKTKESSSKSHKSSSKERNKEEKKDKSSDKKKDSRSSSKSSEKRSKHLENGSTKSLEKNMQHSSSSRSESEKDKKDRKRKSSHHRTSKESKDKKHKKKEIVINNSPDDSHFDESVPLDNEEDLCDFSESDEDAIALECKRIFDEYVPTQKSSNTEEVTNSNKVEDNNEDEYIPTKKRISRTSDKNIKIVHKAPLKPDYKVSAAQTMAARLEKIKEFHASRKSAVTSNVGVIDTWAPKTEVPKTDAPATPSNNMPGSTKIRIAHVPYASTMMNARRTIPSSTNTKPDEPSTSSTTIQTIKKGAQRVAHVPNDKFIDRPGVLEPLASKIAANIRSTYLNMMIDECLKIYITPTDAYARAQQEELATSKKCSTVQIYKNSAVLTVSRLRKEILECNGVKKSGSNCTSLNKTPQSITNSTNSGSWSILSKNRRLSDNSQEFTGIKFYNNIKKWVLTEQQLIDNGFPRPHISGQKGRAIIHGQNKQPIPKGFTRTCCRCKKDYSVDKKGFPVLREECIFHPKNKYRVRGEVKYQCCNQDNSSDGCCIASCHVYEYLDYENLKGYIRTMPPDTRMEDYGAYSLDCEMCYTTHGLDLTRVTVINSACKVVYETLIKPLHPIIDYNTRYSGITEEQMANVKTTLLDVQATLLTMFNSNTILVGHSLESDFKALKLIHDTVIDTSVLFPHKMGPPFKRALRNLSSEYLKKIIQNSVEGHDSAEDATVCMELLIYKLKEDLKTR